MVFDFWIKILLVRFAHLEHCRGTLNLPRMLYHLSPTPPKCYIDLPALSNLHSKAKLTFFSTISTSKRPLYPRHVAHTYRCSILQEPENWSGRCRSGSELQQIWFRCTRCTIWFRITSDLVHLVQMYQMYYLVQNYNKSGTCNNIQLVVFALRSTQHVPL